MSEEARQCPITREELEALAHWVPDACAMVGVHNDEDISAQRLAEEALNKLQDWMEQSHQS